MPTMERSCSSNSTIIQRGRSLYVEARLQGGAPWGFTLKGGLEHRELLIISKVEEGGKADLLDHPLLPGDQVVIINDVELTGFRQEAISLVKGSYKTLRLTVRRECCPTPYSADPRPQSASSNHESCCSEPRPSSAASSNHGASRDSRGCSGGVKLRIKNRRSEPASRPHSWHSTKLGDPQQEPSMMQISQGTMGVPWHQTYHSSASTTDLSSYEAGYLRKSPDQYSSRGSMESLDPPHPAYSSCHQLSASKSSNSIDHLHSKRDSAYSSFSTSSSIPEYLAAAPSFSKERSYSMENVPQQKTVEGMQQADIRYVRTIYDPQQGVSEEHEVTSAALMRGGESRSQSRSGSVQGGACHRGSSSSSGSSGSSCGGFSASQRHSVGPVWVQAQNRNSYENLKGAPAPPLRSDSFAAIRNHERPNSWSSLEQARSVRALQKGSWHHSSGSVATGKSSFGIDGQLHTVIEKSPESSPTTKPKQGFPQASQPGRPMLPTGVYPVPLPEPHFAQVPTTCPSSSSVYPALAKESKHAPQREQGEGKRSGDVKMAVENGYQSNASCTTSVQPQGPAQSKQTQQGQGEPQTKCGLYRPHLQAQGHKTSTPSIVQERRDPYTPTHARGEKSRHPHASEGTDSQSPYSDQVFHSEPVHATAKVPQGQVPNPRGSASPRHHSDSSAYQQRDWGMDHPLTRLENALAEVQMSVGPENTAGQSSHKKERSMSVLEKVSRFERRDQTKPRGQSTLSNHNSSFRANQGSHGTKSSLSSVEDLRNMLERSNSFILQGRTHTASHEGRMEKQPEVRQRRMSTGQAQHGYAPDPATILQRSKSTFQLSEENGNDFHWKNDLRDILGPFQDTSYNRSYRDSIKDAQSKVLRSTSFRRRDLSVHPPLMPSKNMTLERKTPMTTPKPATTSPHTPKERHVVPVEVADRIIPPELPSAPAVGPPVTRIGGRKRLTMEQKKRSYSEPENMHEVGISDPETSLSPRKISQQFLFPETSVADRRRMFELAAGRNTGRKPRPDLKQQQQDALAEYMERKTGRKVEGRSHRPHSAYLQSGSSSTESWSLSSTPSMTSLQEPDSESIPGFNRQPPNLLMGPQSSIHPSRSHSAQAQFEAYPPTHRPQGRAPQPQRPDREPNKPIPALTLCPASEDPRSQTLFRNRDATFERAAPARKSGKSASAEDLLDHTEDRPAAQHFRSRSSPAVENFNQDFLPVDLQSLGMVSGEPYPSTHRENRYQLNPGPGQQNVPVIRRERQKHSERQRAQSTSSLAASVGLPCPLTSPGTGAAPPDWQASERLCQANLDAIAFPCPPQGGAQVNVEAHRRTMGQSSYPSPSTSEEPAQDAPKDTPQQHPPAAQAPPVAPKSAAPPSPTHQEAHAAPLGDPAPRRGHTGPPTLPKIRTSPPKSLPSLRISESALALTPPPSVSQYEDDVFLAPPSPPPPSLPIRETDITEDLPLPPPPICVLSQEEEAGPVDSPPSSFSSVSHASEDTMASRPPSDPSHLPGTPDPEMTPLRVSESSAAESEPRSPPPAASDEEEDEEAQAAESQEAEETERWLLSRREAEAAGQRVEALTRELVARDKSLAPLLDTWAGSRSTLDLMEEIFPTARSLQERQGGSSADSEQEDRTKDVVSISGDVKSPSISRGMETDLDQLEADLNQKKVELLQVLSSSVAVLRGEREGLAEEQKRYSALGASVEALVQERCKPNESDKYRTFIGDLERIVNLLLSLSGRLARVEIALAALEGDEGEASTEERELLLQKRRQLRSQREDARELKENLDRRQRVVLDILRGYLSPAQLRDHRRHARAKPALLVRQRHLDELIKQGEEQLQRLGEDLPPERRPQIPGQAPPSPRPTTVTSL